MLYRRFATVPAVPRPPTATVLVVTDDAAVARELQTYLTTAGLPAAVATTVPAPGKLAAAIEAVVVFPDAQPLALPALLKLRQSRADLLVLVVSSHRARYRALAALAPDATRVLAAPVFGWHLVDEIRRHRAGEGADA